MEDAQISGNPYTGIWRWVPAVPMQRTGVQHGDSEPPKVGLLETSLCAAESKMFPDE